MPTKEIEAHKRPLVVVVGVTASGKSALAMKLAAKINGEIVCADSRTVYKGLDIGTAKPTKEDQQQIKHYLLDMVGPGGSFNAAEFKKLAEQALIDIWRKGKTPILVGGTGLYIDAVIFDYQFGPKADANLRQTLNAMSLEQLQRLCQQRSIELPENDMNKRHLVRAIELGGQIKEKKRLRPNTIVVGITTDKATLHSRIEARVRTMLDSGLLAEVKAAQRLFGHGHEALKGNVYDAYGKMLDGDLSPQQAFEQAVGNDLSLAKRQATWFRRNPNIVWGDAQSLEGQVTDFVSKQDFATIN